MTAARVRPRGRLLTDLADVLRGAGLSVNEVDGWQQRAWSPGYRQEGPVAIIVHHTASGKGKDGNGDVHEQTFTCAVRPMANLYLDRSGRWWVMAGGATNTNGKGGPLGPLPENSANSRVIGIEAGNNGIGEPWPDAMQDSYVAGVAALANQYGIPTVTSTAITSGRLRGRSIPPGRAGSAPSSTTRAGTWTGSAPPSRPPAAVRHRHRRWRRRPSRCRPVPRRRPALAVRTTSSSPATRGRRSPPRRSATRRPTGRCWRSQQGGVALRPGDVPVPRYRPGCARWRRQRRSPGIPPFPGEAKHGDSGPVVLAWQLALIAKGVIKDNDDNRDSAYGNDSRKAVRKLQESWGWSDADGEAGRTPGPSSTRAPGSSSRDLRHRSRRRRRRGPTVTQLLRPPGPAPARLG